MIDNQDLADELAERHGITRAAAREGVHIYLGQINALDGTTWDRERGGVHLTDTLWTTPWRTPPTTAAPPVSAGGVLSYGPTAASR